MTTLFYLRSPNGEILLRRNGDEFFAHPEMGDEIMFQWDGYYAHRNMWWGVFKKHLGGVEHETTLEELDQSEFPAIIENAKEVRRILQHEGVI